MRRIQRIICILACLFCVGCGSNTTKNQQTQTVQKNEIEVKSAESYIGENVYSVLSELNRSGFLNVTVDELADLDQQNISDKGKIKSIIIDGKSSFSDGDVFSNDATIQLTYHGMMKVKMPFSPEEAKSMEYEELFDSLVNAGFWNINAVTSYDYDPDEVPDPFMNQVKIDGFSSFRMGDEYPCDSQLTVLCHYPYDKYTLKLHVDFYGNLFFDKYDVNFSLNNNTIATIPHGKDYDYSESLKAGKYTLTFTDAEDGSIKKSMSIDMDCNTAVAYKLSCESDEINLEEEYLDKDLELKENEAKVPVMPSECFGSSYKNTVSIFGNAGFKNIKTNPVYDIYWGITEEESIASITIEGMKDFKKGQVYENTVPIAITYHLSYKKDPEYIAEQAEKEKAREEEKKREEERLAAEAEKEEEKIKEESQPKQESTTNPVADDGWFYSASSYDAAKKGNSGKYAYRKAGNYYVYWVIDFDNGYVYNFNYGNGDESADRMRIESGDLNSALKAVWHEDGRTMDYYLYFEYKNVPESLIMNDGFESRYSTANLEEALNLIDRMRISDH